MCDDSFAEYNDSCVGDSGVCLSTVDLLGSVVKGVRIVHHNVQGINSKWFEASADSNTIYCFTETWLKLHSSMLTVPGFAVFVSPLLCCPG